MTDRPHYGSVLIGQHRFSFDDFGNGPRLMVHEWNPKGWFEVVTSCAMVGPNDPRAVRGAVLHPMLVDGLMRSIGQCGRPARVRVAKGRWEAMRDSVAKAGAN